MAEWLYRIQPTRAEMLSAGPTADEARLVGEHFAYLQRLVADGTVVLAGRTLNDDATAFGIVIYRAADEAAARAVMDGDPAVRAGVMRAELFPYRIALMAGGAGSA
jgi:uncharacterized protein YciI